tara:strand:- start:183 stop:1880 length:1698 start_codon:yes stop_codon:yes gene_type:complete
MAIRVGKTLLTPATDLSLSSTTEKLQQVDFLSFTAINDADAANIFIYSNTNDASTFPSGIVPLHKFTVQNRETKILTKEDFPVGDANSFSFGNDSTYNKLLVSVDNANVIVHYSVTDAGVSTDYTTEQLQDIVGAMVDGGTETNIAVTYDDTAGKLNFVSVDTDTNTQLTLLDSDTMTGASATNVASAESVKAYVDGAVIANTDTQDLSIVGQTLSLTNGGSVTLPDTNTQLDNAGVIGKVLTGLNVGTTADVVAADTIVAAIGKLENRVATNDDKVSFPGLGTSSSTALAGNTALLQLGTSSSTALAGNTALLALGTSSSTALAGNTALLALGTSSSTALAGDTTTITTGQASAISANTLKNTNVVGDLSFTAVATKLQINTTNGAAISIPAATNTAWGAMSDDLVIALEANTAKPSFPAAVATGNILWKQVKVTLSEAQLTSMHSQAIQLIPAAGANTIIMVGDALALVDRDSSTAQGVASDLCIGYNGTTNYYESILYERRFMYNESGDRTWSLKADYSGEVGASLTAAVNVDVTAAFNVAITSGSLDSVTLYIQYYIIDNS